MIAGPRALRRFPSRLEAVAVGMFCVPFLAFGFALAPGLKRALARDPGGPCGCIPQFPPCTQPCSGCCPGGCKSPDLPPTRAR